MHMSGKALLDKMATALGEVYTACAPCGETGTSDDANCERCLTGIKARAALDDYRAYRFRVQSLWVLCCAIMLVGAIAIFILGCRCRNLSNQLAEPDGIWDGWPDGVVATGMIYAAAEAPSPTHFRCFECQEWDYVKNLQKHYRRNYEYVSGNDYWNLGPRGDGYVHPACSKVEKCDCSDGWREKGGGQITSSPPPCALQHYSPSCAKPHYSPSCAKPHYVILERAKNVKLSELIEATNVIPCGALP
jgi:hypothetical protein